MPIDAVVVKGVIRSKGVSQSINRKMNFALDCYLMTRLMDRQQVEPHRTDVYLTMEYVMMQQSRLSTLVDHCPVATVFQVVTSKGYSRTFDAC